MATKKSGSIRKTAPVSRDAARSTRKAPAARTPAPVNRATARKTAAPRGDTSPDTPAPVSRKTATRKTPAPPAGPLVPVLPLRDVVFFPSVVMPLLIGRQASVQAIEVALATDERTIFLVTQRDPEVQEPKAADLYETGVLARVVQVTRLPNGATKVLFEGRTRGQVAKYSHPRNAPLMADVRVRPLLPNLAEPDPKHLQVVAQRALSLFDDYVGLQRRIPPEVVAMVQSADTSDRLAYGIAAHAMVKIDVRQRVLDAETLEAAFTILADALSSEIELLRMERKIDDETRGAMFQNQREFYLQEQLKAIHRELGQEDADDYAELDAQVRKKMLPEPVRVRVQRELRKLRRMSPMSPEYTVARNFVDWISSLPWDERTDETLDLAHARRILDADHYGLEDVKDRILDYIAVLSLVGRLDGPILCLVGPPGVGKTSLGRSIARALGRKFVRMSLGGVRDEAEIRGHRRTYIGAMPGRIIQSMRRAEVVNPVILLDEVDKLGQDYRGDPAAALLEVLDPEQHYAFNDHYLEVDYDLSQVLFVTTANSLAGIPEALRDRMETIRLAGYLDQEKLAIARQYLLPRQLEANGLEADEIEIAPEVLPAIMRGYTREAGVREFERRIARMARKLARKQAESETLLAKRTIGVEDLKELLGSPPYDPSEMEREDKVGVSNGLAYTQVGGETLEVEVSVVRGRGRVSLTGTLGDVMKESASAAISYVRTRAKALGIATDFYKTRDIHIHIPDGATPKDGPSAGIAIATAVVSALTGVAVRGDIAMTGEITLRGRVLPIGGLKEKSVAAHRNRIYDVIIPYRNERDIEEMPEEVREAVRFHPVRTMDEVLTLALREPLPRIREIVETEPYAVPAATH